MLQRSFAPLLPLAHTSPQENLERPGKWSTSSLFQHPQLPGRATEGCPEGGPMPCKVQTDVRDSSCRQVREGPARCVLTPGRVWPDEEPGMLQRSFAPLLPLARQARRRRTEASGSVRQASGSAWQASGNVRQASGSHRQAPGSLRPVSPTLAGGLGRGRASFRQSSVAV